jgi:hypothetical protein
MYNRLLTFLTVLPFLMFGCASKPLPTIIYPKAIYPISHYPMSTASGGLKVAAVPFTPGRDVYAEPTTVIDQKVSPPLNVLEAGVLLIRLIVLNETRDEIILDPEQIIGTAGSVSYRTYSPQDAADLVGQSKVFKEAIKGSQVGPVVNSILGGEVLVEAAKSGAGGAASGGITGGATGAAKGTAGVVVERAFSYEKALMQLITREYTEQAIKRQTLLPDFVADGLIFLPSRVGITELRIQAYDSTTKKSVSLKMALPSEKMDRTIELPKPR